MKTKSALLAVNLCVTLAACGGATEPDKSTDESSKTTSSPSTDTSGENEAGAPTAERRDVRAECSDELERLESCGQATSDERTQLESMLCGSTNLEEGQIASVVYCLAQWECGGAVPPCLEAPDPQPECTTDEQCPEGTTCDAGVCQPASGPTCADVRYSAGTIGDGTKQLRIGQDCTQPGDCLSNVCVTAWVDDGDVDTDQDWCGNKGDCRNPNNVDEECPSGFTCEEVFRGTFDDQPRWLCVPSSVEMCR